MIEVENLVFRYDKDEEPVLQDISLTIADGEYLALIGPNGCGKTTLIQHFNALLFPTAGTVKIDGLATSDARHLREIRRRVGMVFQNPDHQIVGMTVEEDIAFGPGNLGLSSAEIRQRVDESLERVGLKDFAKRAPHSLSGGEKRLVGIAGVLAMRPGCLVLDEPTSHLDPAGKERVLATVGRLHGEGFAVVHITHDLDEIISADRIAVMKNGRIHRMGTPGEIFAGPEMLEELGLGIPKAAELMRRLKMRGEEVRTDIFTLEAACDEIAACLQKSRSAAGR